MSEEIRPPYTYGTVSSKLVESQELITRLQARIDELKAENKALRLIADSHSMSELRSNRIMAGWRRGDTLKNEVKHESKYY